MSLVPIFYDLARQMDRFADRAFHNDFGFGIDPQEIFETPRYPRPIFDLTPMRYPLEQLNQLAALARNDKEKYTIGKDGFEVSLDVKHFKPNELKVTATDNYVLIEGKHEEREDDHGLIERHFTRRYMLPYGYNRDQVISTISTDGVLTVKAAAPKESIENKERVVQIQETGVAHAAIKDKSDTPAIKN